jgi:hypothetical protein
MFVNGFLQLIEAGIVRREVFADATLQRLLNSGAIADETVTPATLVALRKAGRIQSPLRAADVDFLLHFGVLRPGVCLDGHRFNNQGVHIITIRWGKVSAVRIYCDTQVLTDCLARNAAQGLHEAGLPPIED